MVELKDIAAAADRIAPVVVRTPLLASPALDEIAGATLLIKPENLQLTGSFKIRGAYNMLSQLSREEARHGVVAFSSGNHAQAVAASGTMLGIVTGPRATFANATSRSRRRGSARRRSLAGRPPKKK